MLSLFDPLIKSWKELNIKTYVTRILNTYQISLKVEYV
jgi:hypothetical protein